MGGAMVVGAAVVGAAVVEVTWCAVEQREEGEKGAKEAVAGGGVVNGVGPELFTLRRARRMTYLGEATGIVRS